MLKNHTLATLPTLRPMMEKVRKALFDILQDRVQDAAFLDLFAGSGAVGIEALSRGADRAVFIDHDRDHYNLIKKNITKLGLDEKSTVRMMRVEDFIDANEYPYDIVVAAPWYQDTLDITGWEKLLAANGILVIEHESQTEPPTATTLHIIDKKRYGGTALTFYSAERKS
ncbi:MAG: 16S rRNA (guanine(966)-N(2))-methyltransferase RsmD [Patescibacteria group bacterium]|nr:16S rRNA (guanine(966)-N(2))-methyltransferase RsmD [Patescibacteria group bacterium]